jgi:hypothetical protein
MVLLFGGVFAWFWDKCNTGFIKCVRQFSFPFYCIEQFKEAWYQVFFKGLIEFSRESIRSWTFLFEETLDCCSNFTLCYRSIQVINFSLGSVLDDHMYLEICPFL